MPKDAFGESRKPAKEKSPNSTNPDLKTIIKPGLELVPPPEVKPAASDD
jgi:hypothetical protein